MKNDQDASCERVVLQGTLKTNALDDFDVDESQVNNIFDSEVRATVNLCVLKYTFSGARI